MATQENESVGGFSSPGATPGGGAAALQYQHFTTDTNAGGFLHGGTLGRGTRSVPSTEAFFSSPPPNNSPRNLSGGQFGSGGAKDTMEEENED